MAVTSGRNKVFKLIARGVELDLFEDETIFLSNNVTGLFDLGKLPSDFTRQITIPGTRKNNDFFQHVYDISIDEPFLFKTNTKVIAQFDFDGFYVSQGYIQLNKVNIKENKYVDSYEVSVYGLLSSFKKDLQNTTLTQLSTLDNYDHIFSIGNIVNSWSGSSYDGSANPLWTENSIFTSSIDGHNLGGEVVYCLQDAGKQIAYQSSLPNNLLGINNNEGFAGTSAGGQIKAQNFKPAMRLDIIVDAIFNEIGYTYESTFLSESRFDDTYVLLDRGFRFPVIDGVNLETYGQIEIGPVSGSTAPLNLLNNVTSSLGFTNVYYDPSNSIIDAQGTYSPFWGSAVVASSATDSEVTLNILVSSSSDPATAYPTLYINPADSGVVTNGIELTYINQVIRRDFQQSGGEKEYTLTQELPTGMSFTSGSETNFVIGYTTTGVGSLNVTIGAGGNTESRIKIKSLNQLGELLPISMADNMPFATSGITLLDFIVSIQKKFNLQIYPSKTKPRHFIIETFNNWYKQGKVKNFDTFVDLNQNISVTPANNLGVREVEFGDKLDIDFLSQNFSKSQNREFGKSYFRDTQNFFSEGKLEVESGFSSSPLRYVAGSGITGSLGVVLTAFEGVIGTTISAVCMQNTSIYYHNGSSALPVTGDTIYYDSAGTQPIVTYDYLNEDGGIGSGTIMELNAGNGVIINDSFGTCAGASAPTS
tara:strand:+ start:1302 stop:3413 length:2112 start_codon:yes stop_codon:yes gene_type:complete